MVKTFFFFPFITVGQHVIHKLATWRGGGGKEVKIWAVAMVTVKFSPDLFD